MIDAARNVTGEFQTSRFLVALNIGIQARLINWYIALFQTLYFVFVDTTQRTWLPISAMQAPVTRPT